MGNWHQTKDPLEICVSTTKTVSKNHWRNFDQHRHMGKPSTGSSRVAWSYIQGSKRCWDSSAWEVYEKLQGLQSEGSNYLNRNLQPHVFDMWEVLSCPDWPRHKSSLVIQTHTNYKTLNFTGHLCNVMEEHHHQEMDAEYQWSIAPSEPLLEVVWICSLCST